MFKTKQIKNRNHIQDAVDEIHYRSNPKSGLANIWIGHRKKYLDGEQIGNYFNLPMNTKELKELVKALENSVIMLDPHFTEGFNVKFNLETTYVIGLNYYLLQIVNNKIFGKDLLEIYSFLANIGYTQKEIFVHMDRVLKFENLEILAFEWLLGVFPQLEYEGEELISDLFEVVDKRKILSKLRDSYHVQILDDSSVLILPKELE